MLPVLRSVGTVSSYVFGHTDCGGGWKKGSEELDFQGATC